MARWLIWAVILLSLLLRISLYLRYPIFRESEIVRITTTLTEEPTRYERSQVFRVEGLKVSIPRYPSVNYGDTIILEGKVESGELQAPKVVKIESSSNILLSIRYKLIGFYKRALPAPDATLITGMVLGSKDGITTEFWNELTATGTAHVVVASGMNVSLVAGFVLAIFLKITGRKYAVVFTIISIWLYVILTGFDAPIVRAGVMGTLTFLATYFGRVSLGLRILIVTSVIMLFIRPEWAIDVGFLLSFAATASVLIFGKRFYRLIKLGPDIFREALATSLAAQVGVGPILFLTFGQFNLFSPLINAVILWTVPIITIVSIVSGLIGLVLEPLGSIILLTIYPLTRWFIVIVKTTAG